MHAGVDSFSVNLEQEQVIVETALPSWKVQEMLESTGLKTILRGRGAVRGLYMYQVFNT